MGAFYRASVAEFLTHTSDEILGSLLRSYQHQELRKNQTKAWQIEIEILKDTLADVINQLSAAKTWTLLLEYPIPRRQKRLDGVLLASDVIFCLEFKTLDKAHSLQAQRQVEDYALDLRDFHEASRGRKIVPIVIVPRAQSENAPTETLLGDVVPIRLANSADLASVILSAYAAEHKEGSVSFDASAWDNSSYRPALTIIEAAEALYAGHNVAEIMHSHAGAENLTKTTDRIIEIIREAQRSSKRIICFVTGIPGAGKTLTGLSAVHNAGLRQEGRPAGIFLSGNGPLVKVVTAAISRDRRTVTTFIQNVHVFIETEFNKAEPPTEKIVVFDEAQRAWNAEQNLKKNGLNMPEPETMLSIMDRHQEWAVIVALVGGGQEIHSGEGGLEEWGKTLRDKYPHWEIAVSPNALRKDASTAGHRLFEDRNAAALHIREEPALHLAVNVRSQEAEKLADWVNAVLAGDEHLASGIFPSLQKFPMTITRSLPMCRNWLRLHARGLQRAGLVASSGALRLRADGIELSSGFRQRNRDMYVHWFLKQLPDIRSSSQLEIAASEFECQGLELDWVGMCWGGDFLFDDSRRSWICRTFAGSKWLSARKEIDQRYLLNTYRVLLTRARRGMIIWVPEGDLSDETRLPAGFDATADYLTRCGLPVV